MPRDSGVRTDHHEFRPWFGQVLTVAIAVICAVSLAGVVWQNGVGVGLRVLPFFVAVAGSCWALFWRPRVVVDPAGVRIVNIARTIWVPWPSIEEVDTKWSLTLDTAYGRFSAWAAPAPGAAHIVRSDARREARNLPRSTDRGDGIRPGDLPTSPAGGAALMIRTHWERLRDAGHLDDPKLEFERVPVEWHWRVAVAAVVVMIACIASVVL